MKAVMLSIRPEWCEKIAQGKKTVEIRKTSPKLQTPFKCYIYCTERGRPLVYGDVQCWGGYREEYTQTYGYSKEEARKIWDVYNGHVMGEFVCDRIDEYTNYSLDEQAGHIKRREDLLRSACMTLKDWRDYIGSYRSDFGYAWHISDLEIYDTPKELSEFRRVGKTKTWAYPQRLTRPPQSWCYVEELT